MIATPDAFRITRSVAPVTSDPSGSVITSGHSRWMRAGASVASIQRHSPVPEATSSAPTTPSTSRWRDDRIETFPFPSPDVYIYALAIGTDGTLWALRKTELVAIRGDRATVVPLQFSSGISPVI